MEVSEIKVINFRNFESLKVEFSPKLNVFLGYNGQGKTNLLESLYLMSQGKTFRYSDNQTLIKKKCDFSLIKGKIQNFGLDHDVKIEILKSKKNIFINDKKVTTTELNKKFCSIIFSPESLSAIKESAENRRNLVDELLITFDPIKSELISDFRKALKTRNRILKNYVEGSVDKSVTENLIESINPSFLNLSAELTFLRLKALHAIQKDFNDSMKFISNNSKEIIIDYIVSSENVFEYSFELLKKRIASRMIQLKDAEFGAGTSLIGPQRHDIQFLYDGNDSRFFCSQGQQRAIILSFKMAQIVYHRKIHGFYPILMLDDVLSELDMEKRGALISFLRDINTQIFLTTTDITLPEKFEMGQIKVHELKDGTII